MLSALTGLIALLLSALLSLATAVIGSDTLPHALVALADTERAFAKLGWETNFRDAFLQYFAEEAVDFDPEPGPALERLRALAPPPADLKLFWEPRLGDIAASGDLGYLTGPTETRAPGRPTRYGNYFSVWKKQADGTFKVILDVGITVPEPASFADGFVRAAATAAYKGADSKTAAEAALLEADRVFARSLGADGAAAAYATLLLDAARVHRSGFQPLTSREAGVAWMRDRVTAMTSEPLKSETSQSRDLGYTWGRFTTSGAGRADQKGYYVRVWVRGADGKWMIAADIEQPSR